MFASHPDVVTTHARPAKKTMLTMIAFMLVCALLIPLVFASSAQAQDSRIKPAINWAQSQVGSHSYDYWCAAFCFDAYAKGAGTSITRSATAKAAADTTNAAANRSSEPPAGTFVFFDWWGTVDGVYANYGHMGISLGNGKIIHAFGSRGVVITDRNIGMTYIGWSAPRTSPAITDFSVKTTTTAPAPAARSTVVINDRGAGYKVGGDASWWRYAAIGYGGQMMWTWNSPSKIYNWATWTPTLQAGKYEVQVFIPKNYATTRKAKYTVCYKGGSTVRTVNQNAYYDQWVSLGTYTFATGASGYVKLTDVTYEASGTTMVGFDAMRFIPR